MGHDGDAERDAGDSSKLAQKATQEDRLTALQDALGLLPTAQRIECFDVSHTMGERARLRRASSSIDHAMQTSEYRASTSRRRREATTTRRCAKR
jgi:excinuclease UvrABC nuclease subunit